MMKKILFSCLLPVATGFAAVNFVSITPSEGESAEAYLERVRNAGIETRESRRPKKVLGEGSLEFAKRVMSSGEAEEFDGWIASPNDAAELRKLFDSCGGKGIEIHVKGGNPPLLLAGTGRFYAIDECGREILDVRGCGNIHRVRKVGDFVYYSNGLLYRVPISGGKRAKRECVYRPADLVGGGVLGFDVTREGNFVLALNSSCEVVELNGSDFSEVVRFKVDARLADGTLPGAHGKLRMVRKTAEGTYLVAASSAACVREYDASGKLVWEQSVPPFVFDMIRLANGNTVVSHLTGVTEFTKDHRAVWSFSCGDCPELKLQFLCGIEEDADGSLIVGTWANGASDASRTTAFAVARDKKIKWHYEASRDFNNLTVIPFVK